MTTSSSSHVWQTHHQDSEATINCQIKLELYASCVYLSMSYYFDPYYAALKNFAIYFLHHSHWEKEHAEKLIKLRNQHSGCIFLQDIKKPDQEDWESGLNAMECAVYVEKKVSLSLLELHKMTNDQNDPHVYVFLKTHYLDQKVKSIKQLSDHLTNVRKMPPTHSPSPHSVRTEYLFDKHTLGDSENES